MSAPSPHLWDFAGVDGLCVARALFGEPAARLSVWESLDGEEVSVLRLCEGNFRVASYGGAAGTAAALEQASHGRRVWVKPCRVATLIARDDLSAVLTAATVKPPHRIAGLPAGHAVPARLDGRAVLLWRHAVAGRPVLEIQTAPGDLGAIRELLCQGDAE